MKKRQIAEKTQGHMGQNEDWWTLIQDDDGTTFVRHSWSYTKINGLTTNSGSKDIPASEYFGLTGEALDAKIAELLG